MTRWPVEQLVVIACAWAAGFGSAHGMQTSDLQPPVALLADGRPIDTGSNWGHSGPCLADVDQDGLRDLVVGDFGGKFHWYRNQGSDAAPSFTSQGNLQAGGEDAEVWIY
jgi:hypothetical protein